MSHAPAEIVVRVTVVKHVMRHVVERRADFSDRRMSDINYHPNPIAVIISGLFL